MPGLAQCQAGGSLMLGRFTHGWRASCRLSIVDSSLPSRPQTPEMSVLDKMNNKVCRYVFFGVVGVLSIYLVAPFVFLEDRVGAIEIEKCSFREGLSYVCPVPGFQYNFLYPVKGDTNDAKRSTVILYENEKKLGPSHTPHNEISEKGEGRFSHWKGSLVFSSFDGTNPLTNGRKYFAKAEYKHDFIVLAFCIGLSFVFFYFAFEKKLNLKIKVDGLPTALRFESYFFAVLISLFAVVFFQMQGIQYSPDSEWYSLFSSLYSCGQFDRLAVFPPLFYSILSFFKMLGAGESSYFIYQFICFFSLMSVFLIVTRNPFYSFFIFALLLSSHLVVEAYSYIWTELGYSVLMCLIVYFFYRCLTKDVHNEQIFFLIVLVAILPLQRYIGIFVSLYVVVAVAVFHLDRLNPFVLLRCGIMAGAPFLFLILWNINISGELTGLRAPASVSLLENLRSLVEVLHEFSGFVALYLASFVYAVRSLLMSKSSLIIISFVPLVQLAAQLYASTSVHIDPMGFRYVVPVIPAVLLIFCFAAKEFIFEKQLVSRLLGVLGFFSLVFIFNMGMFDTDTIDLKNSDPGAALFKTELSSLYGLNNVGIYFRGISHGNGPSLVLSENITPGYVLRGYEVTGSWRSNTLVYSSPDGGPYFLPVTKSQHCNNLDAIFIQKDGSGKWESFFNLLSDDFHVYKENMFGVLLMNRELVDPKMHTST